MTSSLLLLGFVLLASTLGARSLRVADWTSRAPRLGILAWQSLSASVGLAVTLTGLSLTLALPHVSRDVASVTDLCAETLARVYGSPGGAAVSLAGLLLLVGTAGRFVVCGASVARSQRCESRRLASLVDLVAVASDQATSVRVIEHPIPYAFCVPGARPRVVVTSALLASLTVRQLSAVLEHERAHMRQRHHLVLQLSQTFATAFGRIAPFLCTAHDQTRRLVELVADDCARRNAGDRSLAHALAALSEMPVGSCALAASAPGVEERVHRLTRGSSALSPLVAFGLSLAVLFLVLAPFALAMAPALATRGWQDLCFVGG